MRWPPVGLGVVILTFVAAPPLASQVWEEYDFRELEFDGVGFEAGRVWPARVESATAFGLRLDMGFITPATRIVPAARFWSSSLQADEVTRLAQQIVLVCERQVNVTCPDRLELGEVRLSDLELAVDAQRFFFVGRRITPFAGVGLGLHLLNGSGDFIDGTFVEDLLDTVSPGLGPLFGLNARIGSAVQLLIEVRMMLAGDVRFVALSGGGIWTLPTPSGN
jgi:hypothetical protein